MTSSLFIVNEGVSSEEVNDAMAIPPAGYLRDDESDRLFMIVRWRPQVEFEKILTIEADIIGVAESMNKEDLDEIMAIPKGRLNAFFEVMNNQFIREFGIVKWCPKVMSEENELISIGVVLEVNVNCED